MASILFPLRTSVELFGDRLTPEIVTRVKEAAVLYDELIFEDGLYTVEVLDTGSNDFWHPRDHMTPELVERSREAVPPGTEISMAMGVQPGLGQPPTEMFEVMRGRVEVAYAAQFHTGILDELEQFKPDWVSTVATGGSNLDPATLGKVARELEQEDSRDPNLLRESNSFYRSWVLKVFNRDAVLAAHLGASFGVTGMFAPVAARARGGFELERELTGREALALQVPDVGALPWEAVVEFREHAGSQEARTKLREFEARAANDVDPRDAYEFLRRVSVEVNSAYQSAYDDLRESFAKAVGKELAKTGISFIPLVGPFLGYGASAAELAQEYFEQRKSWIAALMRLR